VLPPGVVEVVVNGPSSTGTPDESADRSQWQRWRAMQVASGGSGQPCTTPAPLTIAVVVSPVDLALSERSQLTTTFSLLLPLLLPLPGTGAGGLSGPLAAAGITIFYLGTAEEDILLVSAPHLHVCGITCYFDRKRTTAHGHRCQRTSCRQRLRLCGASSRS